MSPGQDGALSAQLGRNTTFRLGGSPRQPRRLGPFVDSRLTRTTIAFRDLASLRKDGRPFIAPPHVPAIIRDPRPCSSCNLYSPQPFLAFLLSSREREGTGIATKPITTKGTKSPTLRGLGQVSPSSRDFCSGTLRRVSILVIRQVLATSHQIAAPCRPENGPVCGEGSTRRPTSRSKKKPLQLGQHGLLLPNPFPPNAFHRLGRSSRHEPKTRRR